MINEGIYRSPKWLRNFLDFELNTGSDIKGEPSKKEKEKQAKRTLKEKADQEKAKQRAELKKWDDAWEKLYNVREFREFLNTLVGDPIYFNITSYQMDAFRKTFRGDMSIFEDFSKYYDDVTKKEKEREDLKREIESIIRSIGSDFRRSPYRDKLDSYYNRSGEYCIKYQFEDGYVIDIFDIKGRRFKYKGSTYTIGTVMWNLLIREINDAQSNMKTRPRSGSSDYNRHTGSSSYSSSSRGKSTHPKYDRYKTLLDTIDLRKKQLSNMAKNDPERGALQNELDAAQRMADKMKREYKFENIKGFNDFDQLNS